MANKYPVSWPVSATEISALEKNLPAHHFGWNGKNFRKKVGMMTLTEAGAVGLVALRPDIDRTAVTLWYGNILTRA